jgi:hypothetical protein
MLGILIATAAFGAEPQVEVEKGWVYGHVLIDAPAERVLEVLQDPVEMARIDDNGVLVTVNSVSGQCKTVDTKITQEMIPAAYVSQGCPIANGWDWELVASKDFKEYHSQWRVESTAAGTVLSHRLRTVVDLPVPQMIVNRKAKAGVAHSLGKLRDHLQ